MRRIDSLIAERKRGPLSVFLALAAIVSLIALPYQVRVQAQGSICSTSSPSSGSYSVTVCIAAPPDGAALAGDAPISASVSVTGTSPGVQKLLFYLNGEYLLTDYASPYTFILPTTRFVDGSRLLEAEARLRDGFTSGRAAVSVTFSNGITQPPVNNNSFTPAAGSAPDPGRPFVLAAAGDGASGEPNADAVTDLIAGWGPNMFLYLGDVYDDGTSTEFQNWYGTGDERYSRFRAITNPTIGNHEYQGFQAPGYFEYWDNVPHYYSYEAAGWHLISLDSTSQYNQTAPGTPQYDWLVQDLSASTTACRIAYFHHPVYNIGPEGNATRMNAIWALLAQHGVDIILTGHDHDYQRWHPLDGQGALDPNGMTQFVVGTGGHGIQDFVKTDGRVAVGFDTPPNAFGALRLELNPDGAAFQFVNIQGTVLDSGSIPCSAGQVDATPPSAPSDLTAISNSSTHIDLAWMASTDNVGVSQYEIFRDGALIATTGAGTAYADHTVTGGMAYEYRVRARDAAGNVSALSSPAAAAAAPVLFSDDFESGSLAKWTSVSGLTVQQQEVYDGTYAARGTSSGSATWAYKQLSAAQASLYYRLRFKIVSQQSNVYLLKFRTASGASILGVYVSSSGRLSYRNDIGSRTSSSTTTVTQGVWHDLQARASINGAASQVEIWLDGVRIDQLSKTDGLGNTPIGRIQLGDNSSGRSYDVAFDNVTLHTSPIDTTPPVVVISDPAENAAVRGEVSLAASASDNTQLDRVEFFADQVLVGTDYTAPYTAGWDSTARGDGPAVIAARAVDVWMNSATSASRPVTVDNTPPETSLDSGPAGTVSTGTATFTFSSSEPGASFTCHIDDQQIEDCLSPHTFNDLPGGSHTFEVVAVDAAGNVDPVPASRTWTVSLEQATPTPTHTATFPATETSTSTSTPIPTDTPTDTPTATQTLTAADTSTPTSTETATETPTDPAAASETPTDTPTVMAEASPTLDATFTPTDTVEASPTATDTPTSTPTDLPAATSTDTPTPEPTHTPTETFTPLPTDTLTNTATDTPAPSATATATITPSHTATPTHTTTSTSTGTSTPTQTPGISILTFAPVADAYVYQSKPTSNYGSSNLLRADGSPIMRGYLRFDIQGINGTVTRVTLRIYANSASSSGYNLGNVTDHTWTETGINYNNAPPIGASVGTSGPFSAGSWTTVDLTPLVTGNGTLDLGLYTTSSTAISFNSRQAVSNVPQLIVEIAP